MGWFCAKSLFWYKKNNSSKKNCNHNKRTKNSYIRYYSNWLIRKNIGGKFYRVAPTDWTALHPVLSYQTTFYESKVDHLLVPKFFHEKANGNFVGKLKFVRRIDPQPQCFSENKNIGRALYLYKSESSANIHIIYHNNLDRQFPEKYSEKIGLSIRGFDFIFPNLKNSLEKFIEPSPTLINSESGQEGDTTAPTRDFFSPKYK